MIAILIPVLDRPARAQPLIESIARASTLVTEIVFLVSPGDDAQLAACLATDEMTIEVPFPLDGGDYARKINYGVLCTEAPWIFQASDDLAFHHGWDREAVNMLQGKPTAGVIGTNDLGNPVVRSGAHSTHSLIKREYIEELGTIDERGKAMHEGYWHCWVDNELVETAKHRRAYFAARRSLVEHLHHIWPDRKGGRKGENDATYRRGQRRYTQDARLFKTRRPLWRGTR
jgi:glycosyltransferase involved in cell wall biosynthesis